MANHTTRRELLQGVAATGLSAALVTPGLAALKTLKIGVVAPKTGQLALFGEHLDFVVDQIQKKLGGKLDVNGVIRFPAD